MAEKVGYDDLFDANLQKEIDNLKSKVQSVYDEFKKMTVEMAKVEVVSKKTADSNKSLALAQEKINKQEQQSIREKNKIIDAQKKLTVAYQKQVIAQNEIKKAVIEEAKYGKISNDSLLAKEKQLKKLKDTYKVASEEIRKGMIPEIQKLDKEVKELNTDIGNNQVHVGDYANQIGNLSPKFGQAANGVLQLKDSFVKLMATPLGVMLLGLTAIIGGMVAAFKIFASTDSGGTRIQSEISGIKERFDELRRNIIDGDWGNIFKSIVNPMTEAVNAARGFELALDNLNDKIDESKAYLDELKKQASEELYFSKDRTKTAQQRLKHLQNSENLERKILSEEIGFAKERLDLEIRKLSVIAKTDKETLRAYANASAAEKASILEKNENLRNFRNSNEQDLLNLIEISAAKITVEKNYFDQNKRLLAQKSAAIKEVAQEEIDLAKQVYNEKISILNRDRNYRNANFYYNLAQDKKLFELESKQKEDELKMQLAANLITQTQYNIGYNNLIAERSKNEKDNALKVFQYKTNLYNEELKIKEDYENTKAYFEAQSLKQIKDDNDKILKEQKEFIDRQKKLFDSYSELENPEEIDESWITKNVKLDDKGNVVKQTMLERLGISKTQLDGIKDGFSQLKDIITQYYEDELEIKNENLDKAKEEVQNAKDNLNAQKLLAAQGLQFNTVQAQKELDVAKKAQKEAEKERAKALKNQRIMQSIEQAGNLVTASTKILKAGNPLIYIPLLGLMWGTFFATKIKAANSTKQYAKGGSGVFGGGSHASGDDTLFMTDKDGTQHRAEKNEAWAIINKKSSAKYKKVLPSIFDSINKGTLKLNSTKEGKTNIQMMFTTANLENKMDKLISITEQQPKLIKGKTYIKKGNTTYEYI